MFWGNTGRVLMLGFCYTSFTINLTTFAPHETELDRIGQMIKMLYFGIKSGRQSMTGIVKSRGSLFPTMKPLD